MAPVPDHDANEDLSTPIESITATVVFSVFVLGTLALAVLKCACCGGSAKQKQQMPTGDIYPYDNDPNKHQGDDQQRSGGDEKDEGGEKAPKRPRQRLVWSKSNLLLLPKAPPNAKDPSEDPLTLALPPGSTGPSSDQERVKQMPTVFRHTGLSPPPSNIHVPSAYGKTRAGTICVVKKQGKQSIAVVKAATMKKKGSPDKAKTSRLPLKSIAASKMASIKLTSTAFPPIKTAVRPDPVSKLASSKPFLVAKTVRAPPHPADSDAKQGLSIQQRQLQASNRNKAAISTEVTPIGLADTATPVRSYEVQAVRGDGKIVPNGRSQFPP